MTPLFRRVPLKRPTRRSGSASDRSVAIIGTRGYPSFYGGFETAVRHLAPFLAAEGWDVLVYGRGAGSHIDSKIADKRVRTRNTRGLELKSFSTLTHGLTACLDAAFHKPDVALIMNVANGYWLPILKMRKIPTVVNVDGIEWEREKWGRLAKSVFYMGAKLTAKYADEIIADSRSIQEYWKRKFGADTTFVAYGGDVPGTLKVPDGLSHRGYVLVVARFVPENTMNEFLEAVPELAKNYPVMIVGSSGYEGDLDGEAARLNACLPNVRWYGHIKDDALLLALWQHAGVYFHGHSVGGTNPALVQAMACGVPVVARDTVYNREVLATAGVYCEPTAKSIVESITRVISSVAVQEDMSRRVTERARNEYTWDKVNHGYSAVLDRARNLASSSRSKL